MCFNPIRENKILAKISEFTVIDSLENSEVQDGKLQKVAFCKSLDCSLTD